MPNNEELEENRFTQLKTDGKVTVTQVAEDDDEIEITQKQYDPSTGVELSPRQMRKNRKQLRAEINLINDEIERLRALKDAKKEILKEFKPEPAEQPVVEPQPEVQ